MFNYRYLDRTHLKGFENYKVRQGFLSISGCAISHSFSLFLCLLLLPIDCTQLPCRTVLYNLTNLTISCVPANSSLFRGPLPYGTLSTLDKSWSLPVVEVFLSAHFVHKVGKLLSDRPFGYFRRQ